MELQLKNTGMIKEANVKIDGLTVIAGENDTGKSTVGKALFDEVREYIFTRKSKRIVLKEDERVRFPVFIDTPNLLVIFEYIKNTAILLQQNELNFDLPIETTDLILRLSQVKKHNKITPEFESIKRVIQGEVYYDKYKDCILFKKNGLDKALDMEETSNGIKMFGFFQILLLNQSIQEGTILILDEPEVHLHPKWQLEMAKIIVELVEKGVKIVVNSHSPYMIDALKYYSDREKVKSNFYLAEKNRDETSSISDVTMDISPIFEKLTEPLRELRKMKLGLK